jgi:hypothetical protein
MKTFKSLYKFNPLPKKIEFKEGIDSLLKHFIWLIWFEPMNIKFEDY